MPFRQATRRVHLRLAKDYLAQHPSDTRAHVLIARAHIRNADFDAAYQQLRRAIRIAPRNEDVLYYMGVVSARLAEQQLLHLAEMAPESARVHQLQAEALEAQERRSAAEEEYEAALKVNPDLLDALLGLAKLKRIRLACEDAIGLYEKAETIRPTFDGAYGLGVCYSYLQRDDEAVGKFDAATQARPEGGRRVGGTRHVARKDRPSDRRHPEAAARHRARTQDG